MFQNRISGFVMSFDNQPDRQRGPCRCRVTIEHPASCSLPVQIADIYQAAMNRALQDHELDKLFNPDFYDYQI